MCEYSSKRTRHAHNYNTSNNKNNKVDTTKQNCGSLILNELLLNTPYMYLF